MISEIDAQKAMNHAENVQFATVAKPRDFSFPREKFCDILRSQKGCCALTGVSFLRYNSRTNVYNIILDVGLDKLNGNYRLILLPLALTRSLYKFEETTIPDIGSIKNCNDVQTIIVDRVLTAIKELPILQEYPFDIEVTGRSVVSIQISLPHTATTYQFKNTGILPIHKINESSISRLDIYDTHVNIGYNTDPSRISYKSSQISILKDMKCVDKFVECLVDNYKAHMIYWSLKTIKNLFDTNVLLSDKKLIMQSNS